METPEREPWIHEGEYVLTPETLANLAAMGDYVRARYGKGALADLQKRPYADGADL